MKKYLSHNGNLIQRGSHNFVYRNYTPISPVIYVNMPNEYNGDMYTVWTDLVNMPSTSNLDIFVFKFEACFVPYVTSNFAADLYWNTSTETKWRIRMHNSSRTYGVGFVTDTEGTYGTSNWSTAPDVTTRTRTANSIKWICWPNWTQNANEEIWMPVKLIFVRSENNAIVYLNETLIGSCDYNDDPINITRFGLLIETNKTFKAALRKLIIAGCSTMEEAINL